MTSGDVELTPVNKETANQVRYARQEIEQFASQHLGLSALHPQQDPKEWPGPEGQNTNRPPTNILRCEYQNSGDQDYEMLVNRVELHTCRRNYCLRPDPDRGQLLS